MIFFFLLAELTQVYLYSLIYIYIFAYIHFFIDESLFNLHLLLRNWTARIAFYKATKLNMVDNEDFLKLRISYQVPRWSYSLKFVHLIRGLFFFLSPVIFFKTSLPTLSLFGQDAT